MPEESAAVQVENEDGNDEDDDKSGGEEKDDQKEAWFIGRLLLDVSKLLLQLAGNLLHSLGKVLRFMVLAAHVGLDAALCISA